VAYSHTRLSNNRSLMWAWTEGEHGNGETSVEFDNGGEIILKLVPVHSGGKFITVKGVGILLFQEAVETGDQLEFSSTR